MKISLENCLLNLIRIRKPFCKSIPQKDSFFHIATAQINLHTNLAASHCFTVSHESQPQITLIAKKKYTAKKKFLLLKKNCRCKIFFSAQEPHCTHVSSGLLRFYNKTCTSNGLKRENGPPIILVGPTLH